MTPPPGERQALVERLSALSSDQRRRVAGALAERRVHDDPRGALLTAWITGTGERPVDVDELRTFLEARLPPAMVPGRFAVLDELPRTSAGKIDRTGTRGSTAVATAPIPRTSRGPVPPRTATERALAEVWADVLGMEVDALGVHDDFFEIGGDSLLSIRVISRAARAGITLSPETFFDTPTLAALAAAVEGAGEPAAGPAAEEDPGEEGTRPSAPTTPIQAWFFERITAGRNRWNQARLLAVREDVEAARAEAAVAALVRRHDGLRLRFAHDGGRWWQRWDVADDTGDRGPTRRVTLPEDPVRAREVVAREADREHAALDLEEGRLFRAVWFEGPGERLLLLLAHHILVDAISWELIVDDLSALLDGVDPPAPTASVSTWARALARAADVVQARRLAEPWLEPAVDDSWVAVPVDFDVQGAGTHGTARVHRLSVPAARASGQPGGGEERDRLLAAVLLALHEWTGRRDLQVDLEGIGRNALPDGPDVSRTVGWFTTVFPVAVSLPDASPGGARSAVTAARTRLPMGGAAWGLLRHLHPDPDLRARLASRPRSQVLFNYLGRMPDPAPAAGPLRPADGPTGNPRSDRAPRAYVLEINAWRERDRFEFSLEYSTAVHRPETIAAVAGNIERALTHRSEAGESKGPRLDLAGLDAAGFDRVAELLDAQDEPETP